MNQWVTTAFALGIACLVRGGSYLSPTQIDASSSEVWSKAVDFKLSKGLTDPDLSVGAEGAAVKAFRVGKVRAGIIADRLDRKGLALFLSVCKDSAKASDIRVEFLTHEEVAVAALADGGIGGWFNVYRLPASTPSKEVDRIVVSYRRGSEWTK